VRQASALACKGSMCHPKGERKKRTLLAFKVQTKMTHNALVTAY